MRRIALFSYVKAVLVSVGVFFIIDSALADHNLLTGNIYFTNASTMIAQPLTGNLQATFSTNYEFNYIHLFSENMGPLLGGAYMWGNTNRFRGKTDVEANKDSFKSEEYWYKVKFGYWFELKANASILFSANYGRGYANFYSRYGGDVVNVTGLDIYEIESSLIFLTDIVPNADKLYIITSAAVYRKVFPSFEYKNNTYGHGDFVDEFLRFGIGIGYRFN